MSTRRPLNRGPRPTRLPVPAAPRENRPPPALAPAARRRLILLAVTLGVSVFAIGTAAFAFFFTPAPSPDAAIQSEPGTPASLAQMSGTVTGITAVDETTTVPVRQGGEFVHALVLGGEAGDGSDDARVSNGFDRTNGEITFNPVYALAPAAQTTTDLLFPRLLDVDPVSGLPVSTGLARSWAWRADGRTITFELRTDLQWSDGTPVTAADFLYTYGALARPETRSPYQPLTSWIEELAAPDPQTLVVTLTAPNCGALHSLRHPLLPSHHYAADYSDLATNPLNQTPEITAGPFVFEAHTPGVEIVLARNEGWSPAPPALERYVLRAVDNVATAAAQLAAGEVDLVPVAPDTATAFAAMEATRLVWQPQPSYAFLAANLADPRAPQSGLDATGTPAVQSPHPILGEPGVRTALARAINHTALAERVGGFALGGYLLPTLPWTHSTPPAPAPHDAAEAAQLLDTAGWTLAAGESVRRREDVPLALRLATNEDNPRRVALAQAVAEDLRAVGVDVRVELLDFEEMTSQLLEQRFDLTLAGWENLAPDPALHPFWHSRDDLPGRGFNFTSFQDAAVDGWLDAAWASPGCDSAARGALYAQVQTRVQEQLPWLVIVGDYAGWAVRTEWQNVAPQPWQLHHNVTEWGQAAE